MVPRRCRGATQGSDWLAWPRVRVFRAKHTTRFFQRTEQSLTAFDKCCVVIPRGDTREGEFFMELALADYDYFRDDRLSDRSGLVTHAEFVNYFGPFASRIFLLCDVKKN